MTNIQKTYTKEELLAYAQTLAKQVTPGGFSLLLLSGTLGAGKTTFAQAYLQALGIHERITSPTYTLGNTYNIPGNHVYHLDLYRIPSIDDYLHLGFHDILSHHIGIWVIEWPELILEELRPFPYTHITLTQGPSDETRILTRETNN